MPTIKEADFIRVWLRHGEAIQLGNLPELTDAERRHVFGVLEISASLRLCTVYPRVALTPRGEDLVASAKAAGFDPDACPRCLGAQVLASFDGNGLHPAPDWDGPIKPWPRHVGADRFDGGVVHVGEAIRCECYVEPCKTCHGSKRVAIIGEFTNPCPDCKDNVESISGDIEGVQVILQRLTDEFSDTTGVPQSFFIDSPTGCVWNYVQLKGVETVRTPSPSPVTYGGLRFYMDEVRRVSANHIDPSLVITEQHLCHIGKRTGPKARSPLANASDEVLWSSVGHFLRHTVMDDDTRRALTHAVCELVYRGLIDDAEKTDAKRRAVPA